MDTGDERFRKLADAIERNKWNIKWKIEGGFKEAGI